MIKRINNKTILEVAAINLAEDYEEILCYKGEEILIIEVENGEVIGEYLGVISDITNSIILINNSEIAKCIDGVYFLEISDNYIRYVVADI